MSGDIVQLGQKLENVKTLGTSTSARVNATHEDALSVYSDIFALILPDINVPKIKEDADIARREVCTFQIAQKFVKNPNQLFQGLITLLNKFNTFFSGRENEKRC